MSNTGFALIGLACWAILLSFMLVGVRVTASQGGKALNSFDPTGKDMAGFGYRVTRAHGNTLENLAIFVALLLYALATGQTPVTEGLACWLLYARVGQSVVHMISTSVPFVLLRATFFSVQLVICLVWAWRFWHA
ncbi:MAG: MAPEG family protein [Gammaproteobacteria bacterium]